MSKPAADHTRFTARFNELPWYRSNVPCMEACPVHTDSGRYVQLIAEGRFEDAFLIARAPNPLASVCGRVCSAPCEDACRRGWVDEAVTIRPLKRFVTERYGAESAKPDFFKLLMSDPRSDTEGAPNDAGCRRLWHLDQLASNRSRADGRGHRVAVIGSGPTGLGCAHDLALMGFEVTVFEALPQLGGMLRYGIPEYRLPRGVIDREIAAIEKLGVTFLTNRPITNDFGLRHLREEGFEAIFLSVGAMRGRDLEIEGAEKDGVIKAVAYFGMVTSGYTGFQDFVRTSASLINLGGFLLPLFALLLGVFSFLTHREYLEILATQPVSRRAILLGKYLGLLLSVLAAAALGFGLPGVVMAASIGVDGAGTYLLVVFFSCLLAAVFTGLAVLIALLAGRRPIALGVAIAVWIFYELVYGLLMLATTLYLPPGVAKNMLLFGLGGNPVDVVRVLCLLQVGGPSLFGPAGATLIKFTGSTAVATSVGLVIVVAWIVVPMIIATWVFKRQDL